MNTSLSAPAVDVKPLNIGVAGLGKMGVYHLERLGLRDDCRVVAVHDHCPQTAEKLPSGEFHFRPEWQELIHDPEVELVLIATPPAAHAVQIVTALHAGKHVAVESPLCLTPEEADAVLAAEQSTGRSVSVIDLRRYDDDFRAATSALAEGTIGKARSIRYMNWHFSRSAESPGRATKQSAWRDDRATGGGALWEFGAPLFGQLLQLTDERPVEMFARLTPAQDCPAADEAFLAVIGFDRGLTAVIDVNRASPATVFRGWTITGDAGSYADFTQYTPTPEGEIVDVPQPSHAALPDEIYGNLVRNIRLNEPAVASATEARQVLVLVAAARNSAAGGGPVPIEF